MKTFQHHLARILGILCATIFIVLVIDVLWGVIARKFDALKEQSAFTQDLATFLLVWLSLLGGVLAYADDRHLGVDVLVAKLHPRSQKNALLISHLCVLGFSIAVFVVGGYLLFTSRWESGQTIPALGIRKAWFYLVIPIAGVLITLLGIGKVVQTFQLPVEEEGAR